MADYVLRVLTPEQASSLFATKAELDEAIASGGGGGGGGTFTGNADDLSDGSTHVVMLVTERDKLAAIADQATKNATDASLRDRSTHTGVQSANTITGLSTVATSGLYSDMIGTVPPEALPPLAINEVFTVTSASAMTALTAQRGDIAIRSDIGRTYILSADNPAVIGNWVPVVAGGDIVSVAGKVGAVTLVKGDVGLGNVDNTADLSKPISTATQTALDLKLDKTAVGTAAAKAITDFATSTQGSKADTAVQPGSLGTAAFQPTTAFATAAQGAKANTALQPGDVTTSTTYEWVYSGGAYPALPASNPGYTIINARGPVAPTTLPSWVGHGSGKCLAYYFVDPLLT